MAQNKWKLQAINLEGTLIPFSSASLDAGINKLSEGSGGTLYPEIAGLLEQKAKVNVTSPAIKTILDIIGVGGFCLTQDTIFHFVKQACTGAASGSVHATITLNSGLVEPVSLNAAQGGLANMSVRFHADYDGTNAPWVAAVSAAAPAVHRLTEQWHLGPVSLNSNLFETEGFNITFGLGIDDTGSTGLPYPDFISVEAANPTANFESKDGNTLFGATGAGTIGRTMAAVLFYLRKGDRNTARVANATLEHLRFTFADTYLSPASASANAKKMAMFSTDVTPIYDGSNLPLVYASGVAIPSS